MASETQPPSPPQADSEETRLLRAEVEQQQRALDAQAKKRDEDQARQDLAEELKGRVSVAAIILTTALSFIGNVKATRADAASGFKAQAASARQQGAELWAYYQTKLAERTSLELARDRVQLDLTKRGLRRDDEEARLDVLKLASYEERIANFAEETQRVFYRVQELEQTEDVSKRRAVEPGRSVERYEFGSKLITLALILLSVTILSNKRWLLWAGIALGSIGLLIAFDGYFLLL